MTGMASEPGHEKRGGVSGIKEKGPKNEGAIKNDRLTRSVANSPRLTILQRLDTYLGDLGKEMIGLSSGRTAKRAICRTISPLVPHSHLPRDVFLGSTMVDAPVLLSSALVFSQLLHQCMMHGFMNRSASG